MRNHRVVVIGIQIAVLVFGIPHSLVANSTPQDSIQGSQSTRAFCNGVEYDSSSYVCVEKKLSPRNNLDKSEFKVHFLLISIAAIAKRFSQEYSDERHSQQMKMDMDNLGRALEGVLSQDSELRSVGVKMDASDLRSKMRSILEVCRFAEGQNPQRWIDQEACKNAFSNLKAKIVSLQQRLTDIRAKKAGYSIEPKGLLGPKGNQ